MRHTQGDDFATLVRTARITARLSQRELAAAVDVSRETISRWEFGRQKPETAEPVAKLAAVLRLDFEQLMRAVGLAISNSGKPEPDPRLRGLDPNDPVVRHIMALDLGDDEEMRGMMLDRRRQQLAARNEQDIAEIEFWANRGRGAA
jgi:transcriptional regulator with XRE-family HTH domain